MPETTDKDYVVDSSAVEQKKLQGQKDLLVEAATDSEKGELDDLKNDIVWAQEWANAVLEKNEDWGKEKINMVKEMSDFFKDPQNQKKHETLYSEYSQIKEKVINSLLDPEVDSIVNGEETDLNKVDDSRDANSLDMQRWDEEERHVSEMDEKSASEGAERVLSQQPKKYENRKSQLDDVLNHWTEEQKGKIYNTVNNMPEISEVYKKVEAAKNSSN